MTHKEFILQHLSGREDKYIYLVKKGTPSKKKSEVTLYIVNNTGCHLIDVTSKVGELLKRPITEHGVVFTGTITDTKFSIEEHLGKVLGTLIHAVRL